MDIYPDWGKVGNTAFLCNAPAVMPAAPPPSCPQSRLQEHSWRLSSHLPRIQHGLLDVIQADDEPLCGHLHPGKPVRGAPKALLGVPDPNGGQPCAPCAFDDLLIKASIEVGLVMVVPGKVHVNMALTDQVFERVPNKPGDVALSPCGAGRIMAEEHAPARLVTQGSLRGVDLADPDHSLEQTGVYTVDMEPRWQERNGVMGVREAPAVTVERIIDLRLGTGPEFLPIVMPRIIQKSMS